MPIGAANIILRTLDPDAASYCAASGATETAAISKFFRAVKDAVPWSGVVGWLLRTGQAAGTGTTAHSFGGYVTASGTLTNGPTWGSSGITFNGSNQYIDCLGAAGLFNAASAGLVLAVASDTSRTAGAASHGVVYWTTGAGAFRAGAVSRLTSANVFAAGGRRLDADSFVSSTTASSDGFKFLAGMHNWTAGNITIAVDGTAASSTNYSSGAGSTSATNSTIVNIGSLSNGLSDQFPGIIAMAMGVRGTASASAAEAIRAAYKETLGAGLGLA